MTYVLYVEKFLNDNRFTTQHTTLQDFLSFVSLLLKLVMVALEYNMLFYFVYQTIVVILVLIYLLYTLLVIIYW